jgi:multidrug efflux pump subunit AcrB
VATLLCARWALGALLVTTHPQHLLVMGTIMVVGIVHKNGILMLDSEQHFSAQGLALDQAIFEAGRRRLRPILMTALATISGCCRWPSTWVRARSSCAPWPSP